MFTSVRRGWPRPARCHFHGVARAVFRLSTPFPARAGKPGAPTLTRSAQSTDAQTHIQLRRPTPLGWPSALLAAVATRLLLFQPQAPLQLRQANTRGTLSLGGHRPVCTAVNPRPLALGGMSPNCKNPPRGLLQERCTNARGTGYKRFSARGGITRDGLDDYPRNRPAVGIALVHQIIAGMNPRRQNLSAGPDALVSSFPRHRHNSVGYFSDGAQLVVGDESPFRHERLQPEDESMRRAGVPLADFVDQLPGVCDGGFILLRAHLR